MSGVKNVGKQVDKKMHNAKLKKQVVMRPVQTKSSIQRQNLALNKRMQSVSLVPDEVLYCVFKYITISDLLRCCCVCKTWKEVAEIPNLWEKQFKKLPKVVRDLSSKAKTTGEFNWKKECIFCAKKRSHRLVKKLAKDATLFPGRKVEVLKSLDIHWLVIFEDSSSNIYQCLATEDFVFNIGKSVRWNEIDIPPLCQMKVIKLYALTPLFLDEKLKPKKESVCTRSLILSHSFKDHWFTEMKMLCEDQYVSIHALQRYLYFGLWKTSLPKEGEVAFIGMCSPLHNLINLSQQGTSSRIYQIPKHEVVVDDIDLKYGLHSYTAIVELRNCRKSFFYEIYKEFNEGFWEDNVLHIEHRRYRDYVFYDIKDKISFTWKTSLFKGLIENFLILDSNLYDSNQHLIWCFSSPVKMVKLKSEQDNYSYEDSELWMLEKTDDIGSCVIELMMNTATSESTILSIKFLLVRSFVNQWFGTCY